MIPSLHEALAPSGGEARDVFEAIEQARVEAIGAQRMQGVAANLAARMEQRYERSRFSEATERSEAPLPDALGLLVREKLTGADAAGQGPRLGQSVAPVDRGPGAHRARPHAGDAVRPGGVRPADP